MDKQEHIVSKMDELLEEIRSGRAESAASLALKQQYLPKRKQFTNLLVLALFLSVIVALTLWYSKGSTSKAESTVFIEQVHGLAALATAEAQVKVVIEEEDNELFGEKIRYNFPGTKRELLLIIPATVIAGVDLETIEPKDMKVDEERKVIEIFLPKATFLQDPSIKMDQIRTFSDEGLLRGNVDWDEGFDLAAAAQEQIKQEALDSGILQKADENAQTVIKEFFGHIGYKTVFKRQ
ncbi:DUF4230 domain-containing protein [Mesobacillus thioparans]|uniref:DUF4230 domain-containing protein n=1 Tax=Mesobacillus thioparans TaxID=370439 RepID=UPI0039F1228B